MRASFAATAASADFRHGSTTRGAAPMNSRASAGFLRLAALARGGDIKTTLARAAQAGGKAVSVRRR